MNPNETGKDQPMETHEKENEGPLALTALGLCLVALTVAGNRPIANGAFLAFILLTTTGCCVWGAYIIRMSSGTTRKFVLMILGACAMFLVPLLIRGVRLLTGI